MAIESLSEAQRTAWKDRALPPVEQVAEGMWAIPVPIPDNPLVYTYCYAIAEDTGVVLIDPGWDGPEQMQALTDGLVGIGFTIADIRGVAITHYHRDHIGLVPYLLRENPDMWLAMHAHDLDTLEGFRSGRTQFRTGTQEGVDVATEYGVPDDRRHEVMSPPRAAGAPNRRSSFAQVQLPDRLVVLGEGEALPVNGREVLSMWTPGHTYGHSAFRVPDASAFVSGDHVLPTITPNIGLDAPRITKSLGDYLSSLDRMDHLSPEVLVLPAHGFRFSGLHDRTAELKAHHAERLKEIEDTWESTDDHSVYSIAQGLHWSRGFDQLSDFNLFAALAETAAHMHYLGLPVGAQGAGRNGGAEGARIA